MSSKENTKPHWKSRIGTYAYKIKDNKIQKLRIDAGKEAVNLNTGSDAHGKLMPPLIRYRFEGESVWTHEDEISWSKEEFLKKNFF